MVLQRHVLHLDGKIFAPLPALGKHRAGVFGVDVYLHDGTVAEKDQGVSLRGQPGRYHALVKMLQIHFGALEPQEEFRAIAEFQLAVFRKGVEIYRCPGWAGHDRGIIPGPGRESPFQGIPHAFCNGKEPGSAAVHHTGLFEHVQKLGRMLQGKVHAGYHQVHVFFQGRGAFGGGNAFPEHRENGSFHRLGNRAVGFFHSGFHRFPEGLYISLFKAFESLAHAGENAGKDNSGIAPGPQQHAAGNRCGHFSQTLPGSMGTGLYGHVHIVSGVSVRNGKHIEVVDFLAILCQAGGSAPDQVQV